MPYTFHPPTNPPEVLEPAPQHLDHKPVFAMPYQAFDGEKMGRTDCRFVTVGIAQYDPYQVSIKMMRHTEDRWSRQSEEMPLHRVVDMTLFLAKVLFDSQNDTVTIPQGTLQHQDREIRITPEPRSEREMISYRNALADCGPVLRAQFKNLRDILNAVDL